MKEEYYYTIIMRHILCNNTNIVYNVSEIILVEVFNVARLLEKVTVFVKSRVETCVRSET